MLAAGTPEAEAFLTERGIDGPLPIVALSDGRVVTGADVAKVSDVVGAGVDTSATTYDVAIVGLGPAGFSAAVNAGSEGMRVILINSTFSQASSSPKIWNYLGFPDGVTGAELMRRAWEHALMFGAVGRIGRTADGIRHEGGHNVVSLDDGSEVTAEVVMLAIGVDYRRIGVESVDRLIGRGVFYGFSAADALALSGLDVAVVGGANSAVQAAISLARDGRAVHLIVRGDAPSASDYLTEQVDALPNVTVHLNSEVAEATDAQQLRSLTLRDRTTGRDERAGGVRSVHHDRRRPANRLAPDGACARRQGLRPDRRRRSAPAGSRTVPAAIRDDDPWGLCPWRCSFGLGQTSRRGRG